MPKEPEILSSRILSAEQVANDIFSIEEMHLQFSNGAQRHYRRIQGRGRGAVLIVPLLDEHTVLLIREYSAGVHRYELQLPKGRVETGESFLEAANRELKEEIGKGARDLRHVNSLTVLPGFMGHRTEIILARDLYDEKLPGDEPEEMEVVAWPLNNLLALANREDCTEARSIAALYIIRDLLAQGVDSDNREE
jgi:ADP-ribose diphosphatase